MVMNELYPFAKFRKDDHIFALGRNDIEHVTVTKYLEDNRHLVKHAGFKKPIPITRIPEWCILRPNIDVIVDGKPVAKGHIIDMNLHGTSRFLIEDYNRSLHYQIKALMVANQSLVHAKLQLERDLMGAESRPMNQLNALATTEFQALIHDSGTTGSEINARIQAAQARSNRR